MRRFIQFLLNALVSLSAILFLLTLYTTYRSYNNGPVFEFSRHEMKWELAAHDGILWLDNQAQCRIEQAEFDARTAYLQPGLHQSWGSAEWRVRLDYFQKLERKQAAVATPAVAHTVRLLSVILLSAVAPIIWSILWLQGHSVGRRRLSHFIIAITGVLALLLCIFSIGMRVRGRWKSDLVSKPTRWHYYRGTFGDGGVVLQSFHFVQRMVSVQVKSGFNMKTRRFEETITPVGPYIDMNIRYVDSDFLSTRESRADLQAKRIGVLKWTAAQPAPPFSHSQATWIKEKLPPWPTASQISNTFGGQIRGRSGAAYVRAETVLIGHTLWLPYWLLIGSSGLWSLLVFRTLIRRRRAIERSRNVLCPQCAYDIRATPERCPECGLAIDRAPELAQTLPASSTAL